MNKRILLLITIVLVFSACKKELFQLNFTEKKKLNVSELNFEYFQGKSKIKYDDGIDNFNASANIRIKKDSIIWVSLSPGIGMEVVRAIIRQDSVFVIDRINKTFSALTFDSLESKFNIKLNFKMLQSLLLGNLIEERQKDDRITKNEGYFVLKQNIGNLFINNFINAKTMKIERVAVVEQPSLNTMEINYNDFQFVDQYLLPFESNLQLHYKEDNVESSNTPEVNISYNRISLDDKKMKFPFNVPNKYVTYE